MRLRRHRWGRDTPSVAVAGRRGQGGWRTCDGLRPVVRCLSGTAVSGTSCPGTAP